MLRELTMEEVGFVSGGEIIVIGGGGIDTGVRDELTGGTLGGALAAMQMAAYGMTGETPIGEDIIVQGAPLAAAAFFPHPWYILFADSDSEDFKEYMQKNSVLSDEELDAMIIVEAKLGDKEFIIHLDRYGGGALYIVKDNTFSNDEFTFFSLIENIQFSQSSSTSAGITGTSVSLSVSSGGTISFTIVGPG
jgi:hypothetical protein